MKRIRASFLLHFSIYFQPKTMMLFERAHEYVDGAPC